MEQKTKEHTKSDVEEPKNNKILGFITIILLLILIIAGYFYWKIHYFGVVSSDDAYINSHQITISTKILGRINKLTVDEGSKIKKGQILAILTRHEIVASKNQTSAALMQAIANYNYAKKNVRLAEINYQKIKQDYDRDLYLVKEDVISVQTFDHEKKAFQSAIEEIKAQKAKVGVALAQITVAKKNIKVVDAQLSNTVIYSPVNGIVVKKWQMPGNVVTPGTPIFTVYDLHNIWVTANIKETDFTNIRLDEKVKIYVDAYPDKVFTGKIFEIGSAAAAVFSLIPPNNAAGNFIKLTQRIPIKISIDHLSSIQKTTPLLPDMSVEVKIETR
ncbi:MAG: HlyD family secretion protein [Candidatus Omnitrophica bacterium]|jgi:membrane fusion protein (multidrug efflux system)|nr:HlyD family secretion protein [Candidatus Omnitrophota bacterium]